MKLVPPHGFSVHWKRAKSAAIALRLSLDRQISGEIAEVLIARNNAIATREEALQTLVNSRFRALEYLQKNLEDAARRAATRPNDVGEKIVNSSGRSRSVT